MPPLSHRPVRADSSQWDSAAFSLPAGPSGLVRPCDVRPNEMSEPGTASSQRPGAERPKSILGLPQHKRQVLQTDMGQIPGMTPEKPRLVPGNHPSATSDAAREPHRHREFGARTQRHRRLARPPGRRRASPDRGTHPPPHARLTATRPRTGRRRRRARALPRIRRQPPAHARGSSESARRSGGRGEPRPGSHPVADFLRSWRRFCRSALPGRRTQPLRIRRREPTATDRGPCRRASRPSRSPAAPPLPGPRPGHRRGR